MDNLSLKILLKVMFLVIFNDGYSGINDKFCTTSHILMGICLIDYVLPPSPSTFQVDTFDSQRNRDR